MTKANMNTFQILMRITRKSRKVTISCNLLAILESFTREEVHVCMSDIKRKRRTKFVRNICLLHDKGISWDGSPVVLNLKKKEIKSIKQETRKTILLG